MFCLCVGSRRVVGTAAASESSVPRHPFLWRTAAAPFSMYRAIRALRNPEPGHSLGYDVVETVVAA
jgi:hypothetical protein